MHCAYFSFSIRFLSVSVVPLRSRTVLGNELKECAYSVFGVGRDLNRVRSIFGKRFTGLEQYVYPPVSQLLRNTSQVTDW